MASFAKATKWLLAGDKVRRKSWTNKKCWWVIRDNRVYDPHGNFVTVHRCHYAATDWVRLVPRKRVDESLYEPVGTVPVVGDRIRCARNNVESERYRGVHVVSAVDATNAYAGDVYWPLANFRVASWMYGYRILKRPERNVFTDPRVGDVVEQNGRERTVLAVHERGLLVLGGGGEVLGYTLSTWAALESHGYTVKHRAEGGAK